ncbi:MAG: YHS domain-containing (seleno)protein [Paracoccaceae bacterium]
MKPSCFNIFRGNAALLVAPALAASLLLGSAVPGVAYDVTSAAAINVDANGVILRGVDATSYANVGSPVAGLSEFTTERDGATYLFASAAARDSFVAGPEAFEPAFGGFCAVGAALGKKLDGDPSIFRIFEGKLYLFVSEDAAGVWDKDPAGTLAKANANWPAINDKTPASLE